MDSTFAYPLAFAVAAGCSYLSNPLVRRLHNRPLCRVLRKIKGSSEERDRILAEWDEFTHPALGASIGDLERLIYIYSVLVADYGPLSAWLVLKAFFNWMKSSDAEFPSQPSFKYLTPRLIAYYLYIYGNGLSLLTGVVLGHGARLLAQSLTG